MHANEITQMGDFRFNMNSLILVNKDVMFLLQQKIKR